MGTVPDGKEKLSAGIVDDSAAIVDEGNQQ